MAITFLFGMGILEDKRLSECWREFVKKFPVVYMVSWKISNTHKPLFLNNFVDYVRLHFVCIVSCALCKDVWIVNLHALRSEYELYLQSNLEITFLILSQVNLAKYGWI